MRKLMFLVVGFVALPGCQDDGGYCGTCRLGSQTELLVGSNARDCGSVESGADAAAVHECLQDARASTAAFGDYELPGIDSTVVVRWVVDADGSVYELSYDSNSCGGLSGCTDDCGPRISIRKCVSPSANPPDDVDPFACESQEPRTGCAPPGA